MLPDEDGEGKKQLLVLESPHGCGKAHADSGHDFGGTQVVKFKIGYAFLKDIALSLTKFLGSELFFHFFLLGNAKAAVCFELL